MQDRGLHPSDFATIKPGDRLRHRASKNRWWTVMTVDNGQDKHQAHMWLRCPETGADKLVWWAEIGDYRIALEANNQ